MTATSVIENIIRLRSGQGRRSDQRNQDAGDDRCQSGAMGLEATIHTARVMGSAMGIKRPLASLKAALEAVVPGTHSEDGPAVLRRH